MGYKVSHYCADVVFDDAIDPNSELVEGGLVGWVRLKPDARGEVVVQPGSVDWNGLVRSLSATEVLEHQVRSRCTGCLGP